ncbi:MAG: hypothetical protein E6I40_01320 [Chloroflexi bacterium]|nr:MAG: hypothetical protein E6I40_01320 [Chloroflexota bacterium]
MTPLDPDRILDTLARHHVDYVLIGGLAGIAWGSDLVTFDLDICYARDKTNLDRLAAALKELGATLRGAPKDLPFQLDARTLAAGDSFTFDTSAGPFDCLGTPTGTNGYPDLSANAEILDVEGCKVPVVSLDDLIRMKRSAGRTKDRGAIEGLGALRDERRGRKRP